MIYKFKLDYYVVESNKNICCAKIECVVGHSNEMVQEILLGLLDLQWSSKIK